MQELVYNHLLPGENDEDLFGIQVVANEFDEVEGINTRLLIGASLLGLEDVVTAIHDRNGLAVAAHIDRDAFSITSQLGFVPPDLAFNALEISRHMPLTVARSQFEAYERFPFITASDAHDLEEIGASPTRLVMAEAGMEELKLALSGQRGRSVLI
jgi:PHP family Zn ribbon phosphoesterase